MSRIFRSAAWKRKAGKNPSGGLNAKGRASYNKETGGNLKAPQPEGGPRKRSFCARSRGWTSGRGLLARKKWKC